MNQGFDAGGYDGRAGHDSRTLAPGGGGRNSAGSQEAAWVAHQCETIATAVQQVMRGKDGVVRLAILALLAEGHLLIEDVPGVGKTSLAKSLAGAVAGSMRRIQFTPDLLPSDVTGVQIYDAGRQGFVFHEGAVFSNVVLGDEINRASPKTQAALLEVMEERQVTVDGVAYPVPRPFIVLATQNPVEHGGTYDLPEAQIDRFMMRMSVGYPAHDAEVDILARRIGGAGSGSAAGQAGQGGVTPVISVEELAAMIDATRRVHVAPAILSYIITLCAATRRMPELRLGASPRGSIALAAASQARAISQGRPFVTVDDVKFLAPYVLAHRLLLRPEAELQGTTGLALIDATLAALPVPSDRG
jgi:MoxR-like ATPase